MKKLILILSIFSLNLGVFGRELKDFDKFLKILAVVESSNNPKAYNKSEKAIGIYQIRPDYFKDAQEFNKELINFTHSDCYNPEISKIVVKSYLSRYCKENDFESWARCHNAGWNWKKKLNKTDKYWAKFKKIARI